MAGTQTCTYDSTWRASNQKPHNAPARPTPDCVSDFRLSSLGRRQWDSCLAMPAPCRPGRSGPLVQVAVDAGWVEIVQPIRPALCMRVRVIHMPRAALPPLPVVVQSELLVTDVATAGCSPVDSPELLGRELHRCLPRIPHMQRPRARICEEPPPTASSPTTVYVMGHPIRMSALADPVASAFNRSREVSYRTPVSGAVRARHFR